MKKQSFTLFTPLSKKEFLSLTAEVKETIAIGFTSAEHKVFTTADLWNIHRQTKSRSQRRFL